jgi:hypothetical protein
VRLAAGRRSDTGPGKPYWKMPLGSTRETPGWVVVGRRGIGEALGSGLGGSERVVGDGVVWVGLDLLEKMAAVIAAPAAALEAAIIAGVAFDI